MNIRSGDALQTVRAFFDAYLNRRDPDLTAGYLTQDVQWLGTGGHEIAWNRDDAIRALREEVAQAPDACRFVFTRAEDHVLAAQCAVCLCTLDVWQGAMLVSVRVNATCVMQDADCRIASIHASMPCDDQADGEYFPVRGKGEAYSDFEARVSRRAVDLLGRGIPGGLIGVYVSEGYPLYTINNRMLGYLGYSYEEFVAATDGQVLASVHPDDRALFSQCVSGADDRDVRYRMLKKDGSAMWVSGISKMGVDEDGRRLSLSVIRDVSDEMLYEELLQREVREKEEQARRYNHLFDSVLCGIVQYKLLPGGRMLFRDANQEAIRIFGYTPESFWAKKDWYMPDLISPSDRERILREVEALKEIGDTFPFDYQLQRRDHTALWIIGQAELVADPCGGTMVQSVYIDINEGRRAQVQTRRLAGQVREGRELLRLALEHTSTFEFYYDPMRSELRIPARACSHFGCGESFTGPAQAFADAYVSPGCRAGFLHMLERIRSGERTAGCVYQYAPGGLWCRATVSAVRSDGSASAVGIFEDITREREMELLLDATRSHDPLTGAFLRDPGVKAIQEALLARDPEEPMALMLVDMDDFDALNAREGRVFADAILQDVASILRDEGGERALIARMGGDEFMMLVPGIGRTRAKVVGPRIASRIQMLYPAAEGETPIISASIGMCSAEVTGEYGGLYRCAESALLYVKDHCRGRAVCYLDSSSEMGTALTHIYPSEHLFNEIDERPAPDDGSMLDFALELLGKARRLDDAVYLLLTRLGTRYGLDRVSVTEVDPEYLRVLVAYQWARRSEDLQSGQTFYLSSETYAEVASLYVKDGVCTESIRGRRPLASCLSAAIWDRGSYAGALCFESSQEDYPWTQEQIRLVRELSRIIASFVMKARADAVSQAKTDFLSRMSHEIRTPMNAISGMTTIAKAVVNDPAQTLKCLEKIESANAYLLTLIGDVLDMSRIESGKLQLNLEQTDLAAQLSSLRSLLGAQAQVKGVALEFVDGFSPLSPLSLDALRLNQVLINIIGNAIKFTDAGGRVTVHVCREGPQTGTRVFLRFSVRDTGIGISPDAQERIFNTFEQGGKNTAARYGGTGLGLAISSQLVKMMGGELRVVSELGKGSEFFFTLGFDLCQGDAAPASHPEKAKKEPVSLQGKRLLVVEDNALNREIAVTLLGMNGFLTEEAVDGAQAVRAFEASAPGYFDAVLMDIRMPVMDGLEATRRIRTLNRPDAQQVPIIAMTANAFDDDSRKSLESGMNGHLTKPLDLDALLAMLRTCLS